MMEIFGENFDACRISATPISAPKRLAIVLHTKKCSMLSETYIFGAEICVAEIRQASKISPNISIGGVKRCQAESFVFARL